MLHVPFRGGVRGGKDQFTWESVKSDKVLKNLIFSMLFKELNKFI
jgi:hypothetical protein